MASWILVPCLASLRAEFNQLAPGRDKSSDGSIGDQAHAGRPSDHNPDESGSTPSEDADSVNEVHAIDVDKELRKAGWSMAKAVEIIVTRHRQGKDDRLQNVIYNRRIWSRSWGWTARAYTGSNPHDRHAHFSARYTTAAEGNTKPWGLLAADHPTAVEEDDMDQTTFNARMDAWWLARMNPNAEDNPARRFLRIAPWQQEVGRTGRSTHQVLFSDMLTLLQQAAAGGANTAAFQAEVRAALAQIAADPGNSVTLTDQQVDELGQLLAQRIPDVTAIATAVGDEQARRMQG